MPKTGDPLFPAHLHCILAQEIQKRWLLKTGGPFIEMTTEAGKTVIDLKIHLYWADKKNALCQSKFTSSVNVIEVRVIVHLVRKGMKTLI